MPRYTEKMFQKDLKELNSLIESCNSKKTGGKKRRIK